MGFLFVDSIERIESGKSARGRFKIPDGVAMPPSLIAEAIGQLAGWIAMERCDFSARPVAGIAGKCVIESEVTPGDEVELEVEARTCDSDAIEYRGSATVDGKPMVRLHECVGPMLPMEEFDDPRRVAKRFEVLRSGGERRTLSPDLFAEMPLVLKDAGEGGMARATLKVPESSPIFREHFPRKPVLPGTLLLDAQIRLGSKILDAEVANGPWKLSMRDVKLRTFISPGATLELEARLVASNVAQMTIALTAHQQGKRIASARMEIEF